MLMVILISLFNASLWTGVTAMIMHKASAITFIVTFIFTFLVISVLSGIGKNSSALLMEDEKSVLILDYWDYRTHDIQQFDESDKAPRLPIEIPKSSNAFTA